MGGNAHGAAACRLHHVLRYAASNQLDLALFLEAIDAVAGVSTRRGSTPNGDDRAERQQYFDPWPTGARASMWETPTTSVLQLGDRHGQTRRSGLQNPRFSGSSTHPTRVSAVAGLQAGGPRGRIANYFMHIASRSRRARSGSHEPPRCGGGGSGWRIRSRRRPAPGPTGRRAGAVLRGDSDPRRDVGSGARHAPPLALPGHELGSPIGGASTIAGPCMITFTSCCRPIAMRLRSHGPRRGHRADGRLASPGGGPSRAPSFVCERDRSTADFVLATEWRVRRDVRRSPPSTASRLLDEALRISFRRAAGTYLRRTPQACNRPGGHGRRRPRPRRRRGQSSIGSIALVRIRHPRVADRCEGVGARLTA